jgi:hypothetical protein
MTSRQPQPATRLPGCIYRAVKRPMPTEATEKLLRLCATRRGAIVELRVHYAVQRKNGCDFYKIITIDQI